MFLLRGKFLPAVCLLFLVFDTQQSPPIANAQARRVQERLRGVLTRARLHPELRAAASILYSHDGKYLAVQDPAGIFLFSRDPLRLVTYIEAPHAYPARFSADSGSLVILSFDLFLSRWKTADGKPIESPNLNIADGCLFASLSPAADLLACATPDWQLAIYRLRDAKKVFAAPLHQSSSGFMRVPIPFDFVTDFSSPFGFFVSDSFKQVANRGLFRLPIWFSPDGRFVIAGDDSAVLSVNLVDFSKDKFSSPLHKRISAIAGLAGNDRVLLLDRTKSEPPSVFSLSTGQLMATYPVPADSAYVCTNSRFAVFRQESDSSLRIADLYSPSTTAVPDAVTADVYGSEIAVLKQDWTVLFFKQGASQPSAGARLPLGALAQLHAASVDPDLNTMVLSVNGMAGAFEVATGKLLLEQKSLAGARVLDPKRALLLEREKFKVPQQLLQADLAVPTAKISWTAQNGVRILPGQANFLEYSFANEMGRGMVVYLDRSVVPFSLRGIDPVSGSEAWHKKFEGEVPIPFSDPQGSRFVLGWRAKDEHARNALKSSPTVLEDYKHSKRMEQDTVFEIFDAVSGKSIGGVFVQFGDGPINFSSAFSVGDFLFLVKDTTRVTVASLRDGKIILHAKGYQPTPSPQSNLLALDEGYGRLAVYDLLTGTRLEQQQFADTLVYKHFSLDGKKLLVVTQHQQVFVLDMADVREHPLPPLPKSEEVPAEDSGESDKDSAGNSSVRPADNPQ